MLGVWRHKWPKGTVNKPQVIEKAPEMIEYKSEMNLRWQKINCRWPEINLTCWKWTGSNRKCTDSDHEWAGSERKAAKRKAFKVPERKIFKTAFRNKAPERRAYKNRVPEQLSHPVHFRIISCHFRFVVGHFGFIWDHLRFTCGSFPVISKNWKL